MSRIISALSPSACARGKSAPVWRARVRLRLRRLAVAVWLAAPLWLAAPPAEAQERVELKLAHTFPAGHGIHTEFLSPWARDVEKRAGQGARIVIHDGDSARGDAATLLQRMQAGEVDIVHGLPGAYPERFARTNLVEVPFVAPGAAVGSRVLWGMLDKQLKAEYAGFKVLALHTDNGGVLHTGAKRVLVPEDLSGLRLRSPSAVAGKVLAAFGATPLGMPSSQVSANLRAGLIDGALFSWDGARRTRVVEAAKYHLDGRLFTAPYFLLMTFKRYQSLPAAVRRALDESSGAALVDRFGPWWDKWDEGARETARKRGATITVLTAAQRDAWAAKAAPAIDRYLDALTRAGVRDAKAVYTEMRKRAGATASRAGK